MSVHAFKPRTVADVRKNAREFYRIETVETDDGRRVALMLYRLHGDRATALRCLGRFRVEVLRDLADGLREAARLMSGGAHD